MRKLSLFLAVWYLLIGLGIPFPAPAALAPVPAEATLEPGFLCAGHRCGCSTAEDCRRHCCCFPGAMERREPAPANESVSFLAMAQCRGEEPGAPAGVSPRLGSHLPVEIASLRAESSSGRASPSDRSARRVVPADPPDKIPI